MTQPSPTPSAEILIVAGDPSGDRHGAMLVEELRRRAPHLRFWGGGGPHLRQAGVHLREEVTRFSGLGLFDVLLHIPGALAAGRRLVQAASRTPPDLAILIDFGTFNLRVAPGLRKLNIPVLYYFPPGSWSPSLRRARSVVASADCLLTPFPQALPAYQALGAKAAFVGHPLVDHLAPRAELAQPSDEAPLIALLPGSRWTEIRLLLPILLRTAERLAHRMPTVRFALARAATVPEAVIESHLAGCAVPVEVFTDPADALQHASLALVTSGTVTLEAALLGVPMIVVYRVSTANYWYYRWFYRPKPELFAMPNILAGERIVPELQQYEVTPQRLAEEALALLRNTPRREAMRTRLRRAMRQLGEPGATARAATIVLDMLNQTPSASDPETDPESPR